MASGKTYLISGATRGIGRGLVAALLIQNSSTVIAGVRDPSAATAQSLEKLPHGQGSKIILVKINSSSEDDARNAIKILQSAHSVTQLDLVVANAGVAQEGFYSTADIPISATKDMFDVNTLGPIRLFNAVHPLFRPGSSFWVMSSLIGSTTSARNIPFQVGAYGISKAAVNYFISKAAGEYADFSFTSLHPGLVDTDLAQEVIQKTGWQPISVNDSVKGLLNLFEKPKEDVTGKFLTWEGEDIPW